MMEIDMAKSGIMHYVTVLTRTGLGFTAASGQALAAGSNEPGLPQLDISTWPSQIFWLIVIFGIGYWMMAKVITPKISNVLEDRRARIHGDLNRAREANIEAVKIRAEYEAEIDIARNEAAAIARKAAGEAAETAQLLERKADKKLASRVTSAEKKLASAKADALENLNKVATEAALDAVKTLVGLKATAAQAEKIVEGAAKAIAPQEAN
tara:strand:+ start:196 stop:825 length:630 start_codon:yes stop_codon:yes gene_type:complete